MIAVAGRFEPDSAVLHVEVAREAMFELVQHAYF
jgi:hypothetical protein